MRPNETRSHADEASRRNQNEVNPDAQSICDNQWFSISRWLTVTGVTGRWCMASGRKNQPSPSTESIEDAMWIFKAWRKIPRAVEGNATLWIVIREAFTLKFYTASWHPKPVEPLHNRCKGQRKLDRGFGQGRGLKSISLWFLSDFSLIPLRLHFDALYYGFDVA